MSVSYQELFNLIEQEMGSQTNVFIFAPSLLLKQKSAHNDRHKGRIFVLFYEDDIKRIKQSAAQFKKCIVKRINVS